MKIEERGGIKHFRLASLVVIIFLLINVVSALTLTSDTGVEYDSELIGQFLLNNWVHVTVDVKDFSGIIIDYKEDSVEVQTAKDDQRWNVYKNTSHSILSTLSENEFQLKQVSEFGVFFSGNITKEGFNKLLKDNRVDHIYAKKSGSAHSYSFKEDNFFTIFLPIILVIILIIVLIKFKKRK